MLKKKQKKILLIYLVVIAITAPSISNVQSHSPKYVDLKYYWDEQVLSVYITHGVSDKEYHFVGTVLIEFYEFNDTVLNDLKKIDPNIQEKNVPSIETLNKTDTITYNYHNQETHQVFHYNYSIPITEWTFIRVTAFCNKGGSFSNSLIIKHPYWDPEHHMIEAVVPTLVCSVITMTPLAILAFVRRDKKTKTKTKKIEIKV